MQNVAFKKKERKKQDGVIYFAPETVTSIFSYLKNGL